jgi:hypothetical protein
MKLSNAIKMIEKKGYKVERVSGESNKKYSVIIGPKGNYVLEFYVYEDGPVHCIGVRNINDHSDPMTDYCAFVFYPNLTQALRSVDFTY